MSRACRVAIRVTFLLSAILGNATWGVGKVCAQASTPSLESITSEFVGIARQRMPSQSAESFTKTAKALAEVLKSQAGAEVPESEANANTLHTQTLEAIKTKLRDLREANTLTKEEHQGWLKLDQEVLDKLKASNGLFDPKQVASWKQLYLVGAKVLNDAPNSSASSGAAKTAEGSSLIHEDSFAEQDYQELIYQRLKKLGVIYNDDTFPATTRAIIAAIEQEIGKADKNGTIGGRQFQENCTNAIVDAIRANTGGDPDARAAWKEALIEFQGTLSKKFTESKANLDDYRTWKKPYEVLRDGLKFAVNEDAKDTQAALIRQAKAAGRGGAAAATGTSSGSGIGTSHAAVLHERMMAHMRRKHERQMYRIQAIRGH